MKLKLYIQTFVLFFLAGSPKASAESISKEPERIVSITQVFYEQDYYVSQVDLWNQEIQKNEQDANAWMNYYLACRIVNMLDKQSNPHDLSQVFDELSNKIEGTYEFHYLTYLNGKGDLTLFNHLEKAFALDPKRTEVYSHMVNYFAITRDFDQMKFFNTKWLESGEISSGILSWNYNSLMSVEPNGIMLTYGDNDTYPSWMLQQVHNVRPDVKVININLLRRKDYAAAIFKECEIPVFEARTNDELVWNNDFVPLADHIFKHSARAVYVNITLPKSIRNHFSDHLYTVGLAFKYSENSFDNIAVLKNNFENKFLTDHLKVGFHNDKSVTVLNSMNLNYLPAFVNLYEHYKQSEELNQATNLGQLIRNIGVASGRENEVADILGEQSKPKRNLETLINIKYLDKILKPIQGGLWASAEETSNEFYDQFLMDLLRNKEFELLEICKTEKTDWMSLVPDKYKHLPENEIFDHNHPNYPGAPVQNITYEAAIEYCKWLTKAYNDYAKKKNFSEVTFRLPTEQEWVTAARANHETAPYPWGGYFYTNAKGCYLSNFYSSDFPMCEDCNARSYDNDGGFFSVNTGSYFPNDYGLYNLSGNVAEMVLEKGLAKGGSWEDVPEKCKIDSVKKYEKRSPAIGFRVFMEVNK